MTSTSHVLLAAAGGAVGATLRVLAGLVAARCRIPGWVAILMVNTLGCLGIGLAVGAAIGDDLQAFLMAGVLGGFTTFSTAMLDAWVLWRTRHRVAAGASLLGTPVLAVIAVSIGLATGGAA